MRRLVVNLDNTLDEWLQGEVNQNETVRKALYLYKGDITTDDMTNIKESYRALKAFLGQKFETYDMSFQRLDKLISVLETRM